MFLRSRFWAIGGLVAIVLILLSTLQYPGNKLIFATFAVVIFAICLIALRFPNEYAHLFLGVMWGFGFWAKYVIHVATDAPYYEMHGAFDGSVASWDAVFAVIAVGAGGYLAGRVLTLPLTVPWTAALSRRPTVVPTGWSSSRNTLWILAGLMVLAAVAANHAFGLLTRGYVAHVVLPWPLGGLFAWVTEIGLALLLALLTAWDRQAGFGVERGFAALCVEGALISVSTLSRGVYFFHTVPALLTEGPPAAARTAGRRRVAVLFFIWLVVAAAIPAATTFLRLFGEKAVPITQAELQYTEKHQFDRHPVGYLNADVLWNQFVTVMRLLVVDRWSGLEGVMATVAYPDKSPALLAEAASMRRSYGTVDVYTRKISGSTFNEENAKTYHFATIAGPIAFLYFSGSLLIVFVGMAAIAVLISALELLWRLLVRDPLVLAVSGLYLALVVLQLSGTLVQAATGLVTVTAAFAAVWAMTNLSPRSVPAEQGATSRSS